MFKKGDRIQFITDFVPSFHGHDLDTVIKAGTHGIIKEAGITNMIVQYMGGEVMAKSEQLTYAEPRTMFELCWDEVLKESEKFGSGNFIAHEYLEPIVRKYVGDHT